MKLWRASNDDYVDSGYSFATKKSQAKAYLANPGFGGARLWVCEIEPPNTEEIIDLRDTTVAELAATLDYLDPGAIGLDEWLPRTPGALDKLRETGILWAVVTDSFPAGAETWIWCGTGSDNEPELVAL